ncbi:phosphoesterase RecJ-like protein [Alkalihalobacillus xiaoxiensis]|uniref:Phosphoesterase RecJ-like protein n=1 Tax=Shouchella xiaoxiensis TaxID=766895 RepID=A0ABS2ST82_9BACI|nr:bifunctional oligoribonuclease/PAP phosphatase NrnA [Shouchella xiaoxiensis]MBM7838460.1 phosphoesterase RecJ-like protein [Shouchella xiaoxiensis]
MLKHVLTKIKEYKTIIIHRHVRPDPDALGSQLGLKSIIQATYTEKNVFAVGEMEDSLSFLGEMDHITDEMYEGALVIVCDTANTARISDSRYQLGEKIMKLDHHPNEEPYGDIVYVDTTVSSTSELVVALLEETKELILTKEAAFLLYGGIVGDTGRFRFRNTTGKTLLRTARLLEMDFDTQDFYRHLYKRSLPMVRLEGHILQNFEIHNGNVGVMRLPASLLTECGVTANESSLLVNTFADVEGLEAWVFFVEEGETIRCRIRSKSVVINTIAKEHNGGGHPVAAGATAFSWHETDLIVKKLIDACRK